MRILIAEDDKTSRLMLKAVLEKGGHEVVETEHGLEAWERMQQADSPRMAILDWMMPEIDGMELVRLIRALEKSRPPYIIMLTAKHGILDIVEGLRTGADDYMKKPFDIRELLARVEVGRRMIDMQDMLAARISDLRKALDEIKTLRGILPVCANCNKIRDEKGNWQMMEIYIQLHSEARFTHSVCPDCARKLYPEIDLGKLF